MTEKSRVFTKKKALTIVFACALALLALILICRHMNRGPDLSTKEGREIFFSELGWQADMASETCRGVLIPDALDGVLARYNEMQLEQGYDLSRHLGERCEQYTYILENYPEATGGVFITIYVQNGKIIAGDIHTSSINGFMHGIRRAGDG